MSSIHENLRIIFLDIDGVLNGTRSSIGLGGIGNPGHLERGECPLFDPVAVGLLRRLVERTGAQIIVSSTWRYTCVENGYLARAFEQHYGWPGAPIIGRTGWSPRCRGEEIQAWLDQHPETEAFVILDDDADMLPEQMDRLVKTTFMEGLLFEHVVRAAKILGCDLSTLVRPTPLPSEIES